MPATACFYFMLRDALRVGAALLSALTLPQAGRTQTAAAASPSFETYVLPRPSVSAASPSAAVPSESVSEGKGLRPASDNLGVQASMTLFPGGNDLSLTAGGMYRSQAINAQLSPLQWAQGSVANSYFQVGQERGGLRLGGVDALPAGGSLQGLRMSAPWKMGQATFGLGLYQQIGGGARSLRLAPAFDAQWQTGKARQGSAIVASDASWQVSQQLVTPCGQLLALASRDAGHGQQQISLAFEQSLRRFTVVNGRMGVQDGAGRGGWAALGLTQRLGAGYGVVDVSLSQARGQRLLQTGLGLFVPLRGQTLGLRWQRVQIGSARGAGATGSADGTRKTDLLTGTWSAALSPQTYAWASGAGAWERQARFQGSIAVGLSRELSSRWSAQAEITQALDRDARRVRISLGCQVTPQWQLRVLCGPCLRGGASSQAFGVQVVHRFRITRPREGGIKGQALLDGKPCGRRVQVQLDEGAYAVTDAQGRYQFRHVPAGSHEVHLILTELPVWMDAPSPSVRVSVAQGKILDVPFTLREVAQAEGSVHVLPDALGQTDPTAAQGVIVQADPETAPASDDASGGKGNRSDSSNESRNSLGAEGRAPHGYPVATSTNAENHWTLGGLGPGRHVLVLDARSLPPGYEVVGHSRVEVIVTREKPCPPIEFTIAPHARKIEYASSP